MWYKNEHRGIKGYHICGTFCRCEYKRTVSRQSFLFFECISTIKTSAETVTSVTCFGSTVILPNDSEWGF